MNNTTSTTPLLLSSSSEMTTKTTGTTQKMVLTTSSISANESIFLLIAKLLNGTDLYKHQVADLRGCSEITSSVRGRVGGPEKITFDH